MKTKGRARRPLVVVEGGKLKVQFEENNGNYTNVFLIGPATFVFEGKIEI